MLSPLMTLLSYVMATLGLTCLFAGQCRSVETVVVRPVTPASLLSATPMSTAPASPSRPATSPLPTALSSLTLRPESTSVKEVQPMTMTIVYDNYAYDSRLQTAWGFGCLIERGETTLLFDTGSDGKLLLSNMVVLGFDPDDVDIVILSHIHGDHTGGLSSLLTTGTHPTVYVPRSFPASFKAQVRASTNLVEVGARGYRDQ
jgi:hypothetical protein